MKDQKLGVGIIGLGIISKAHEKGLLDAQDMASVVAICDIDEKRVNDRARPYNAGVYTDYRQLLADPQVDVVDIILPHNLHHPVAAAAIECGKHVLIEKPLTMNSSDGEDLIERAQKEQIKFSAAENTRFVQAYLEMEKILFSGKLGDIYSVRTLIAGSEISRLLDTSNWKGKVKGSGGGVIMDAAPHTFYLLRWLFGGVRTLQATAQKLVEVSEVEDNALIFGELNTGALFTAQFSFTTEAPWTERLEVNGSQGSVIIDHITNPVGILYQGTDDFSGRPLNIPYEPELWKKKSIASGVYDFISAVWNDREPLVNPADANYAIYAVEKSYQSVQSGDTVTL